MTKFEAKLVDYDTELGIDSILLMANFVDRTVRTNCGDFYYDYEIPFDDLFRFVDHIKKMEKHIKKMEKQYGK